MKRSVVSDVGPNRLIEAPSDRIYTGSSFSPARLRHDPCGCPLPFTNIVVTPSVMAAALPKSHHIASLQLCDPRASPTLDIVTCFPGTMSKGCSLSHCSHTQFNVWFMRGNITHLNYAL